MLSGVPDRGGSSIVTAQGRFEETLEDPERPLRRARAPEPRLRGFLPSHAHLRRPLASPAAKRMLPSGALAAAQLIPFFASRSIGSGPMEDAGPETEPSRFGATADPRPLTEIRPSNGPGGDRAPFALGRSARQSHWVPSRDPVACVPFQPRLAIARRVTVRGSSRDA